MTDFAVVLLYQNQARYLQPQFFKSPQFDYMTEQLFGSFLAQNRYFYKNSQLIQKKPSAAMQQVLDFFAPASPFANYLIKNQSLTAPMFAAILTDPLVFSSTMYQGSVSNSVFGKFIMQVVDAAINARFSVKFNCFEARNYRNGACLLLQMWASADLSQLNIHKLAALSTGGNTRRIVFLNADEYVSVAALQYLFTNLLKNNFQACYCQNTNVEQGAGDECAGFTAQVFCSNSNAVLEICLRSLTDRGEGGKYYLYYAAFYLLIYMSKFKHIVKLPTYLQIIKNMNYAMRHNSCKIVFALFYEQIAVFLESYLYKLRVTYAIDVFGKMKFRDKGNYYFDNTAMLFASLDQIYLFCQRWREVFNYTYFQTVFKAKDEILNNIHPLVQVIDGSSLASLFATLQGSVSVDGYYENDLAQTIVKVRYRCGYLFDHRTTQVACEPGVELYKYFFTSASLKAAYISGIIACFKLASGGEPTNQNMETREAKLFDVLNVQYTFLNKLAGTTTPEQRKALYDYELLYYYRLEQSGIPVGNKLRNRVYKRFSELSESWQIVLDALRSDLFWLLVIVAGIGIVAVKRLTIWLIS